MQEVGLIINRCDKIVFGFIKDGLKTIDDRKPFLIRGYDLINYLKKLNISRKCPTQFNELYCSKCRASRTPKANEITIQTEFGIRAKGLCSKCGHVMNKGYKADSLERLKQVFTVVDNLSISDSNTTAQNFQISPPTKQPENGNKKDQLCLQL